MGIRSLYYRLVNGKPVPCSSIEGSIAFEQDDRKIDYTEIGVYTVSTVFLGLDHSLGRSPEPILYETMVFGGDWDGRTYRYSTHGEAMKGHWQIVQCLRNGEEPIAVDGERGVLDLFMEMLRDQEEDKTDG